MWVRSSRASSAGPLAVRITPRDSRREGGCGGGDRELGSFDGRIRRRAVLRSRRQIVRLPRCRRTKVTCRSRYSTHARTLDSCDCRIDSAIGCSPSARARCSLTSARVNTTSIARTTAVRRAVVERGTAFRIGPRRARLSESRGRPPGPPDRVPERADPSTRPRAPPARRCESAGVDDVVPKARLLRLDERTPPRPSRWPFPGGLPASQREGQREGALLPSFDTDRALDEPAVACAVEQRRRFEHLCIVPEAEAGGRAEPRDVGNVDPATVTPPVIRCDGPVPRPPARGASCLPAGTATFCMANLLRHRRRRLSSPSAPEERCAAEPSPPGGAPFRTRPTWNRRQSLALRQ